MSNHQSQEDYSDYLCDNFIISHFNKVMAANIILAPDILYLISYSVRLLGTSIKQINDKCR